MRRKTFLKGLICAALLATVAPAAFAQDGEPIRIGEINHYKRMAAFAEPYKKGIELALKEINAEGGVLGRPLEFIFRDDQGDPGEAIKIAEELMTRDGAVMLTGSILSNVGLAIASVAGEKQWVYLAAEPLADAVTWSAGNPYTFRLRSSTYMQAAMLAEAAAKSDAIKYATIAPNYAYGKDAVAAFKEVLTKLKPEVEFVAEQWPALFNIDSGAEVQALERAKPDAIYNVTFGTDLAKFVRDGNTRGLFRGARGLWPAVGRTRIPRAAGRGGARGLGGDRLSLVRFHRRGRRQQALCRRLSGGMERDAETGHRWWAT